MSYVFFVPGLNGSNSIATQTDDAKPGTNYFAVQEAAKAKNVVCLRAKFQTSGNPYPTLSQMGLTVAHQIQCVQDLYGYDTPGLIVASSVGAGVTMQAFSMMNPDFELPDVIAFKPVFDPLNAISTQLEHHPSGKGPAMLAALESGKMQELKIPVAATHSSEDPGTFTLNPRHINDKDALRLVSDPTAFATFEEKLGRRQIGSMTILVAQDDTVASENLTAFSAAVYPLTKRGCMTEVMTGDHADNQSRRLGKAVERQLAYLLS